MRPLCLRPMLSCGPHTPILPSNSAAPPDPGTMPAACIMHACKFQRTLHIFSCTSNPGTCHTARESRTLCQ